LRSLPHAPPNRTCRRAVCGLGLRESRKGGCPYANSRVPSGDGTSGDGSASGSLVSSLRSSSRPKSLICAFSLASPLPLPLLPWIASMFAKRLRSSGLRNEVVAAARPRKRTARPGEGGNARRGARAKATGARLRSLSARLVRDRDAEVIVTAPAREPIPRVSDRAPRGAKIATPRLTLQRRLLAVAGATGAA
jgi:hypothetical protein